MLRIMSLITNAETRKHFQHILARATAGLEWPDLSDVTDDGVDQESLIRLLKDYFAHDHRQMAILISDCLVSMTGTSEVSNLAAICQKEFAREAFGTLAVMPWPRRVADIDRTIGTHCTALELLDKLKLIVGRLKYLVAPIHRSESNACSVMVRALRTNDTEYWDYFRLRHRVYAAMGYLDEEVENISSGLEINEADLHAIHIGAFCSNGSQHKLVGTARVVTMDAVDKSLQRLFEGMVAHDPVARNQLDTSYVLGLPIFQSHRGMNPTIQEIFREDQSCGELSRVIVAPEFRGLGISSQLINEAVRRSADRGVERMFLECLAIHESLYEHHGFSRIAGIEGHVVDVARTMIAMERCLNLVLPISPALGQSAEAGSVTNGAN